MGKTIHFESIAQVHALIGYEKPKHPLISLVEPIKAKVMPTITQPVTMGMYSIALKNGRECKIKYGRQQYDFQEGTLMCMAPGQAIEPIGPAKRSAMGNGWVLLFHPDLLRRSPLAQKMHEYSYFSYDSHEALHLSSRERKTVTTVVNTLRKEYSQNLDAYSQDLILSHLELLLNYCKRFYGRQFITRSHIQKDVVVRFEAYLNDHFSQREVQGLPAVQECAREMGYSANYLSDLLRKETGRSAQEHIHAHLIEKAKSLLLGSDDPVYKIAFALGFEYPQHFSKLFKSKTGMSPAAYRQ